MALNQRKSLSDVHLDIEMLTGGQKATVFETSREVGIQEERIPLRTPLDPAETSRERG
jgi:hypothetical protein